MGIKLTRKALRALRVAGTAALSAAAGTMLAAALSVPADYVLGRMLQKSYLTACIETIDERRLESPSAADFSICPGTGYLVFRPSDGSEPRTAGNPESHGPVSVSRETSGASDAQNRRYPLRGGTVRDSAPSLGRNVWPERRSRQDRPSQGRERETDSSPAFSTAVSVLPSA